MFGLTNEELEKIVKESVEFSNFCKKFKMKWWKSEKLGHISEEQLDTLAEIAFEIFKENK